MIKASKLAVAMAVVGPLAVATVGETFAAPVLTNASAVEAAAPTTATNVAVLGVRRSAVFRLWLRSVRLSPGVQVPGLHLLVPHLFELGMLC